MRLRLSSYSLYTCHTGFGATVEVVNGSAKTVTVSDVELTAIGGATCPLAPVATWHYSPAVTAVAPGQNANVLVLASAPFCCPAPGCPASSISEWWYDFRITTSAGVLKGSAYSVIDLGGCSEVCP